MTDTHQHSGNNPAYDYLDAKDLRILLELRDARLSDLNLMATRRLARIYALVDERDTLRAKYEDAKASDTETADPPTDT